MLPVSDVVPSRRTPVVTIGLILVSVLAFVSGFRLEADHTVPPAGGFMNALEGTRFLVAPALHAGWLHLAGNALALWIFGENVEDAMGRAAYGAFYLTASIIGTVAQGVLTGAPLPGGAGVPIAAVIAAHLVLYPRSQVLLAIFAVVSVEVIEIPALYVLGLWALVQALVPLSAPGATLVDVRAFVPHAAALAFGAAAGVWLRRRVRWE